MIDVMFIVIGIVGAVLLLSSLLFDDFIDELIPGLDFLSGPVVGAFLAAFGLFGWFASSYDATPALVAFPIATVGGIVLGGFSYKLTNALINQPTDGTPTTESLVGATGRVVTPVRADGLGEVVVTLGGATTKFTATADQDLPTGSAVVVVAVESPTKLRVQSEEAFWT